MVFWGLGGCLCARVCSAMVYATPGPVHFLTRVQATESHARHLLLCLPPLPPPTRSFDPLGLGPKDDPEAWKELQTKELNNGRLAMIAIAAFTAQELVVKQEIFEHLALRLEKEVILELDDLERDVGIKNVSATVAVCALSSHQEDWFPVAGALFLACQVMCPCGELAAWNSPRRSTGSCKGTRVSDHLSPAACSRSASVFAHTGHRRARAGAGGAEELSCRLRHGRLMFLAYVCVCLCAGCACGRLSERIESRFAAAGVCGRVRYVVCAALGLCACALGEDGASASACSTFPAAGGWLLPVGADSFVRCSAWGFAVDDVSTGPAHCVA